LGECSGWRPGAAAKAAESVPAQLAGRLRERVVDRKMTETLTKSTVTKIFRQVIANAEKGDQDKFWQFVNMKMTANRKKGIARAIERGPEAARASVADAIKEWRTNIYFDASANTGRIQNKQYAQRQQPQQGTQQHQQQPQQRSQQLREGRGTASAASGGDQRLIGKGKGGAGEVSGQGRPQLGKSTNSGQDTRVGRGGNKGSSRGRTPWANLTIDDQTPLLDQHRKVAKKANIDPDDDDDTIDNAQGYIMAYATTASKLVERIAHRKSWTNLWL
jgi:hypothetical protein